MPAVTDVIKSMPQLSHHRIYGQPGDHVSYRFAGPLLLLLCSLTTLLALFLFCQQTARSWRAPPHIITWTPKPSARWSKSRHPTHSPTTLESLVRPRQGQGRFGNQARDARISIEKVVHSGSPTGSAPVGLGGAGEGSGRMMGGLPEEETTATSSSCPPALTSGSRGVSTNVSVPSFAPSSAPGARPSLSFNASAPLFPAADEHSRRHVGPSRSHSPSSFASAWGSSGGEDEGTSAVEKGKSMEVGHHRFGTLEGGRIDAAGSTETEAPTPASIYSPFAYHMTDDEHVSYTTSDYYSAAPPVHGDSAADASSYRRRTDADFSRPPPPAPLVPPTLASQSLYSLYGTHQAEDQHSNAPSEQTPYYDHPGSMRTTNATMTGSFLDGNSANHEYVPVAGTSSKIRSSRRGSGSNKAASTSSRTQQKSKGRKGHTKGIPIPSNNPAAAPGGPQSSRRRENEDRGYGFDTSATLSPSSFPSTSPFLPPPPPNSEYPFDPAEIMFPGPGEVTDGGIRLVPTYEEDPHDEEQQEEEHHQHHRNHHHHHHHHQHDDENGNAYGEMSGVVGETGGGWKRHTRVYGGGVCLACATAGGGGGGYYGSRVRPEDKRR